MKNSIKLFSLIILSIQLTACAQDPFWIIRAVEAQKELASNCKAGTIKQMRACSLEKEQQVTQITRNIDNAKKH
ncbi:MULTISPECIES: hypothetical protein [unclassified Pseudoalteromonas]|uniref:hypothetical protein n=1 Tax=unclassified Pseudoalteromonas TaxID=194690 RepID=UPI0005A7EA6B|nr:MULTISPECIES: hypothetical protein [unclassified Pseudoalteromonas]